MTTQSELPDDPQQQHFFTFSELLNVPGQIETDRHATVQDQIEAWDTYVSGGMEVLVPLDEVKRLIQSFGLDWDHAYPNGRQIVLNEPPVLEILYPHGAPTQFNVIVGKKGIAYWSTTSAIFWGMIVIHGNHPIAP